jgi:hypothetical protein
MIQSPTGSGIVNIEHAIRAMTSVCQAVSNRMIVFACLMNLLMSSAFGLLVTPFL